MEKREAFCDHSNAITHREDCRESVAREESAMRDKLTHQSQPSTRRQEAWTENRVFLVIQRNLAKQVYVYTRFVFVRSVGY